MKTKLLFFIICTALSLPALNQSWHAVNELYTTVFSSSHHNLVFNTKSIIKIAFYCLIFLAWFLYLKLNYHWIKHGVIGRKLRLFGATVGFTCIALTFGAGFFYALPAVILMFYIHLFTPYPEALEQAKDKK